MDYFRFAWQKERTQRDSCPLGSAGFRIHEQAGVLYTYSKEGDNTSCVVGHSPQSVLRPFFAQVSGTARSLMERLYGKDNVRGDHGTNIMPGSIFQKLWWPCGATLLMRLLSLSSRKQAASMTLYSMTHDSLYSVQRGQWHYKP